MTCLPLQVCDDMIARYSAIVNVCIVIASSKQSMDQPGRLSILLMVS